MSIEFKYICINCNFETNNKKNYQIHLETKKHKKRIKVNELNSEEKKKLELEIKEKELSILEKDLIIKKLELDKKNYIEKNNNNNKLVNQYNILLNFNTICPNALNINEFLNMIKESLHEMIPDVDNFIKQKLEDSIADIVIKNYTKLDKDKKPYYILDSKRYKAAIKDENNEWINMDDDKINEITKRLEKIIGEGICERLGGNYINFNKINKELIIPENSKEKDKLIEIINRSTQELNIIGRKKIYKKMCQKGENKKVL